MSSSRLERGVEMSCSRVPVSLSLDTLSAVMRVQIAIMMTAVSPGMIKFLLFSSGLNQTLIRASTGMSTILRPARLRRFSWTARS